MKTNYHSNGKLLLTAEYLVIDGAKALALPTKYGQKLEVVTLSEAKIEWESFDNRGKTWYAQCFQLSAGKISVEVPPNTEQSEITTRLLQIFTELIELNPLLFQQGGFSMKTKLEFPQDWGLGSSSTLIANLANWAQVNPYELLRRSFGGSGYDIACAQSSAPLTYKLEDDLNPSVETINFDPAFKSQLFFVHLNQKQNSREAIAHYKSRDLSAKKEWILQASNLTEEILTCCNLSVFEDVIGTHENLLSSILALPTVKKRLFPDYPRSLKSLGAWGGDFILATGGEAEKAYFRRKNHTTIIDYHQMVL